MKVAFLMLVLIGGCLGGCSLPANPKTTLQAGPWGSYFSFYDSKDNDVEIVGAEFDPTIKRLKFDRLTIRNNASDVRRANVEQIQAYTEQVKAMTRMVEYATAAIASKLPGGAPPVPPSDAPTSQPSP